MEKKTEKQVREEAQKLARQIGDQEWAKGETKYALEAYEASDISASELLEKAQKLIEAGKIIKEWIIAEEAAYKLPAKGHSPDQGAICNQGECLNCKMRDGIKRRSENHIIELLGWEEEAFFVRNEKERSEYARQFRGGAVACLKLIKRMFPEKKE